jgi:putative acetyltransferase
MIKPTEITLADITIRGIRSGDNPALANIIRRTLKEFGANHPGTVFDDPTTDHLFELFTSVDGSVYYVAEHNSEILGGGGIYPSKGLPDGTCELVKMYLLPEARGIGLGTTLINQCLDFAKTAGYRSIYIETMPELKRALQLYERFGFHYLPAPLGRTGHTGCSLFMLKKLTD